MDMNQLVGGLDEHQLRELQDAILERVHAMSKPAPLAVKDSSSTTIQLEPEDDDSGRMPDNDGIQRITMPPSPPLVAVARADHQDDQENLEKPTTISTSSEPALPAADECADRPTTIASSSDSAPLAADDQHASSPTVSSDSETAPLAADERDDSLPTASASLDSAPLAADKDADQQANSAPSSKTDPWDRIRADHAAAVEKRRQRLTAAAAQRQQQLATAAQPPVAAVIPGLMLDEEQTDEEPASSTYDPWSQPPQGDCRRYAGPAPDRVQPPHGHPQQAQPLGARAAFEADPLRAIRSTREKMDATAAGRSTAPPPTSVDIPLFGDSPLVDWSRLPSHLSLEETKRRVRQLFTLSVDERGKQQSKIDYETMRSKPLKFAQEEFFWIQKHLFGPDTSTWLPHVVCCSRDEPAGFHISIGATLLIIKNDWLRFKQIAARQDLQKILSLLMRLHIRSFGQMLLLIYATRLAGDHNRMDAILKFLDEVLRARDLDYDIALAIQRHVPKMIQGVDAKTNKYPDEGDFGEAAERWCCYCYKAFTFVYDYLSGPNVWSPEWLRSTDVPKEFKHAIDNLVMQSSWILRNLQERIYKLYVLRRIKDAEEGETTFAWTPFRTGRGAYKTDWPDELRTRLQKCVLLVDDENDYLFCDELKEDISIVRVPSSNREDVLRVIRHVLPGPVTNRIYFWFGTQYINNGNHDFGQLVVEICHHFSKHLGHIYQHVVLPPYNRAFPDAWTFDVLGLYLQREQLLPHARVILHPYDVRLWYYDQLKLEKRGSLSASTDKYQSANGTINNGTAQAARATGRNDFSNVVHATYASETFYVFEVDFRRSVVFT